MVEIGEELAGDLGEVGFVADAVVVRDGEEEFGAAVFEADAVEGGLEFGEFSGEGGADGGVERGAIGDDVDFGAVVLGGALADFNAGLGAAEDGFVGIAHAFEIPADVHLDVDAAEGVGDEVVAEVVEVAVAEVTGERGGDGGAAGDAAPLFGVEDGGPAAGVEEGDVGAVVDGEIGEGDPLGEVDKVGADVGEGFALLFDIEEGEGAEHGDAGDGFEQAVHAVHVDGGVGGVAGEEVAEDGGGVDESAVEHGGDLVALGHDVVGDDVLAGGLVEGVGEAGEVGRTEDPGFVGEDVEAMGDGLFDAFDFRAIAAGEDNNVAGGLVAEEAGEGAGSGVDVEFPGGGVFGALIKAGDAGEVVGEIETEGGVDLSDGGDAGVHLFLDEGGVEVGGIEGDELANRHSTRLWHRGGEGGADLGVAEKEGGFWQAFAAEPGGDLFVALAGIAGGAGGDDVVEGIAAAAGEGKNAVALEGDAGGAAVGAAAPGLLEGGPLFGAKIVFDALHAALAAAGGAGAAGAAGRHVSGEFTP